MEEAEFPELLTQNGEVVVTGGGGGEGQGILDNTYPLNLYYAYGIRNSFGIDFDPITAKLWDTENGPRFGNEINLSNQDLIVDGMRYKVYGLEKVVLLKTLY
jgi:glucose/arabinose dehydrogenase